MRYLYSLIALTSVACTGVLDGTSPSSDRPAADPSHNSPSTGGTSNSAMTAEPAGPPFKVRNTEPELVSFDMRIRRIAGALAVGVEHPMFGEMTKSRLKLGAYDYANGALPDGSWNANRIAAWMNALEPICNSPEMKAKYPALPENLPQLVRAAWGHLPSAEDSADFQTAITAAGVEPAVAYESTCMVVFSAAELVYR